MEHKCPQCGTAFPSSESRTTDGGRSSPAGALVQGTPDNVQGAAPGLPGSHDKLHKLARYFEQHEVMVVLPGGDAWFTAEEKLKIANALKSATTETVPVPRDDLERLSIMASISTAEPTVEELEGILDAIGERIEVWLS